MKLMDVVIPTGVIRPGMNIGEACRECVSHNVGGIPFCDSSGHITGRFSLRNTFRKHCLPLDMVDNAHLLGDSIACETAPEIVSGEMLNLPVDDYIIENVASISPSSPVVKALSIMEKFNSSYIFLLDEKQYFGVITRMRIASLMLNYHKF